MVVYLIGQRGVNVANHVATLPYGHVNEPAPIPCRQREGEIALVKLFKSNFAKRSPVIKASVYSVLLVDDVLTCE
jgi:hypothetical protein